MWADFRNGPDPRHDGEHSSNLSSVPLDRTMTPIPSGHPLQQMELPVNLPRAVRQIQGGWLALALLRFAPLFSIVSHLFEKITCCFLGNMEKGAQNRRMVMSASGFAHVTSTHNTDS